MDVVLRVRRFPHAGETIMATEVTRHPGGKGANQAVAAARAGAAVRMTGAVGHDADAEAILALLKADEVDCTHVHRDPHLPTGVAFVTVDETGENQIIVHPGANSASRAVEVSCGVALAQLELPLETVAPFLAGRTPGTLAVLNAAPFHPEAGAVLSLADVVVMNEPELICYSGKTELRVEAAQVVSLAKALRSGDEQTIIVTLGKAGSVTVGPDGVFTARADAAQVLDTTGAGDCFCGVLAARLAAGKALPMSIDLAHRAAAIAVGRAGAAPSMPFLAEFGT